MKRRLLFIPLILILTVRHEAIGQARWTYPLTPEQVGWSRLTLEERIRVQQIPTTILKKMSTEDVFQAWLDLPGRLEVLAFNSMQHGFDVTVERYNVLSELLSRPDVGPVILDFYAMLQPSQIDTVTDDVEKGRLVTDMAFIEFILSQPPVLRTLSRQRKRQLFRTSVSNIQKKRIVSPEVRDFFWIESGLVLAGRILQTEEEFRHKLSDDRIEQSLQRGEIKNAD